MRADGQGDYVHYLRTNAAGDEFRANVELMRAWLKDGELSAAKAGDIHEDIAPLVTPSPGRAMELNAAYRMIVREQSFDRGRDATIAPMDATVWREVEQDQETGIEEPEAPWYPRHW
ncbi:MAG: hypothetical protein H6891_08470 [Brucellaceae bacterium]|nr:hypothetical protein [Brucellaceae bacterium]